MASWCRWNVGTLSPYITFYMFMFLLNYFEWIMKEVDLHNSSDHTKAGSNIANVTVRKMYRCYRKTLFAFVLTSTLPCSMHNGMQKQNLVLCFDSSQLRPCPHQCVFVCNIHAKISARSLAESTSFNPKQYRKLKLSAESWNEIDCQESHETE